VFPISSMLKTSQQCEADLPIRLLLIDDHAMFRAGLKALFENIPAIKIVGDADVGVAAVRLTLELKPDVLLLDLAIPKKSGMDVLRDLAESWPQTKTILLTAFIESERILEAIQLGARGVVLKESAVDVLFKAIRSVMAGQYWLDRGRISDLAQTLYNVRRASSALPTQRAFSITQRERQIVAAVLAGHSNKDIAQELSISHQTVKNHLTSIFDKIGVSSRLELALCATRHKLLGEHI